MFAGVVFLGKTTAHQATVGDHVGILILTHNQQTSSRLERGFEWLELAAGVHTFKITCRAR